MRTLLSTEPAFDGSWFQPFQMLSVTARLEGDRITVKGKKKAQWTARAADKVEIPKAEFVFCGFGIHAPEFGWADGFLNLCEVKYAKGDYALTKAEAEKIDNRVSAFQQETSTDKNILVTLNCGYISCPGPWTWSTLLLPRPNIITLPLLTPPATTTFPD